MVTSGSSVIHEERILSWPFGTIILAVFLTGSLVATVVVLAHHRYVEPSAVVAGDGGVDSEESDAKCDDENDPTLPRKSPGARGLGRPRRRFCCELRAADPKPL